MGDIAVGDGDLIARLFFATIDCIDRNEGCVGEMLFAVVIKRSDLSFFLFLLFFLFFYLLFPLDESRRNDLILSLTMPRD